jgi:queuine/archaeosine tRNA-ribosyltransferase
LNPVIRKIVNQKIRELNVKEIIRLARENNLTITVKQAKEILAAIQEQPFDIGNKSTVLKVNRRLKQLDPSLYKKARKLLKPYEAYLDYSLD